MYLGIPIIIILIIAIVYQSQPKDEHKYSEIIGYFQDCKVEQFDMDLGTGEMKIKLKDDDTVIKYQAPDVSVMWKTLMGDYGGENSENLIDKYNNSPDNKDKPMVYDYKKSQSNSWIIELLPNILIIVALVAFWIFMMRKMSGGLGGDQIGRASCRERV